jgi:hypothetical protein
VPLCSSSRSARIRPDEHRDRARTLRRLAGGADLVACDVGGDDERATRPPRRGAHPVDGGHERRRARVASVLQLVHAAPAADPEEVVDEDADRLRVVDARLGRDEQHADLLGVDVRRAEERAPAVAASVTTSSHDGAIAISRTPSPPVSFSGGTRARRRGREPQRVLRHVHREPIDPDGHVSALPHLEAHVASSPPIRRQRPSAINGK